MENDRQKSIGFYISIFRNVKNFWTVFLYFWGKVNSGELELHFRDGLVIKCNVEKGDVNRVILSKLGLLYPWELLKDIPDRSVVYDLGAGIGDFSVVLGSLRKDIRIYCLEPRKDRLLLLDDNINSNKYYERMVGIEVAIGNYNGNCSDRDNTIKQNISGTSDSVQQNRSRPLRVRRLETLIDEISIHPNVIKMDIGGAEYGVLVDSKPVLKYCHSILLMYHPSPDIGDTKEYLGYLFDSIDFDIVYSTDKIIYAKNRSR